MKIVTSITLPAPRETVWRTFLAVERWPEWSPWGLHFPQQPRFELGVPFFVTIPAPCFPFVTLRFPCRVTVLENPEQIRWTGKLFGAPGYHGFTLEDTPRGCRVVSEEELRGPLSLLLWPAKSIIQGRVMQFLSSLSRAADSASP